MPFTDRFISLRVKIFDNQQAKVLDKNENDCDQFDTTIRINPFKIESYRPAINNADFAKENLNTVWLTMESGEEHLIFLTIDEFENLLNHFNK